MERRREGEGEGQEEGEGEPEFVCTCCYRMMYRKSALCHTLVNVPHLLILIGSF